VEGLTLSNVWVGGRQGVDDVDHECLTQVTEVEPERIVLMSTCPDRPGAKQSGSGRTQLCRADLRDGAVYRTEFGPGIPDLVAGSTLSVLSRRAFRELKQDGVTWIRAVHLRARSYAVGASAPDPDAVVDYSEDLNGPLIRTGTGTVDVLVNDTVIPLPALQAEVGLRDPTGALPPQHETFLVLDDERFPVVLDNQRTTTRAKIQYTKITYPAPSSLEGDLERDRKAIVYGIYFDYSSAEIRPESEPVLREIAGVMAAHPEWRIRIEGHTDAIGGDAFNRDLSVRRATAVRTALAERHRVAPERLDVSGAGASRPQDRNDTPRGVPATGAWS
jgi:outer membrane protein OmpA-like peptidoglycan-associated protein